ncbi:hypothetical protein HWV62_32872 [Athelia sp. TMB]|nr:hypothetical protein HWV62_32872 [Athelia sp. TMB]
MPRRTRSESVEIISYSDGIRGSKSRRTLTKTHASKNLSKASSHEVIIHESEDEEEADPNVRLRQEPLVVGYDLCFQSSGIIADPPTAALVVGASSAQTLISASNPKTEVTKTEETYAGDLWNSFKTEETKISVKQEAGRFERKPKLEVKSEEFEPVRIGVTIKTEKKEDDKTAFITLVKDEKGVDIFNLDGLGLGPPAEPEAPEHAHVGYKGFTRKVISDAFGGGHQVCEHNWYGPAGLAKKHPARDLPHRRPFVTYNWKWNPQLPARPGEHGAVLCNLRSFTDGAPVDQPFPVYVRQATNDWRNRGLYTSAQHGEIAPEYMPQMPPGMLSTWAEGVVSSKWGKSWVEEANESLPDDEKIVYDEEAA